jgi:nucleoside-diphosphate-sugar epimerase
VNIGNPIAWTIKDCAREVLAVTGSDATLSGHHEGEDPRRAHGSGPERREDAPALLGWEPKIPVRQGLELSLDYFRASLPTREEGIPMLNDLSPILITGGAGFVGSNFVVDWLSLVGTPVVNLDKLTSAGNLQNLASVEQYPAYNFEQGDICDAGFLESLLERYQPRVILHFAAESHMDRSLSGPEAFVRINVEDIFRLLEAALAYVGKASSAVRKKFRFCMFRPTRFTAPCIRTIRRSRRPLPTLPTAPTPHPRRPQITLCARTFIVTGCPR